jgi:hypothetical protein
MEKRELFVLTPDKCETCGIATERWSKENPDIPWLKIDFVPGISIFKCPNCHTAVFNPNALNNNNKIRKWSEEDANRRIQLATSIPKDGKLVAVK